MFTRFELLHLRHGETTQTRDTRLVKPANHPQAKHGLRVDEVRVHRGFKVNALRVKTNRCRASSALRSA